MSSLTERKKNLRTYFSIHITFQLKHQRLEEFSCESKLKTIKRNNLSSEIPNSFSLTTQMQVTSPKSVGQIKQIEHDYSLSSASSNSGRSFPSSSTDL